MKIGIIGNGYVGKATSKIIPDNYNLVIYDKDPKKCEPPLATFEDLADSDLIFICVPTPMSKKTRVCHVKIVEDTVSQIKKTFKNYSGGIIIRSTVPVGTSHGLDVRFMPEFLTERSWEKDIAETTDWIIGNNDTGDTKFLNNISTLLEDSFKEKKIQGHNIHFTPTKTAELAKYTSNAFFATKVSFFNEIHSLCQAKDIDFPELVEVLLSSSKGRITENHTQVPGPDGKKGYGGTCLPKDLYALQHTFWKSKIQPYILRAVEQRNRIEDRREQDWLDDTGRSAI
jgi:UDPglucose 6-dehydrogenase